MKTVWKALIIATLLLPGAAKAQLEAHAKARDVVYNGNVGDCDFTISGLPTCELYFRMGVYHNNTLQGSLLNYPGSCTYFELSNGLWNFSDQTVSEEIPNGATGAQMYFALYDQDPLDDDDLLGTHFFSFSSSASGEVLNNDTFELHESCDGGGVDDDSTFSRFDLSYQVWFTDSSAPQAPDEPPSHSDPDTDAGYDNDTTLHFDWPNGTDPHSGISHYEYEMRTNKACCVGSTATSSSLTYTGASNGSSYELRVRARNGNSVDLDNPMFSAWTEFSGPVLVDLVADDITSISAYTEEGGEAIADGVEQSDNTPYLEWTVDDSDAPIVGYSFGMSGVPDCTVDTVAASTSIGPLPTGTSTFYVRAIDAAGNCGSSASFNIVYAAGPFDFINGFEVQPCM